MPPATGCKGVLDIKWKERELSFHLHFNYGGLTSLQHLQLQSKSKVLYIVNLLVLSTRKIVHAINKTFNLF